VDLPATCARSNIYLHQSSAYGLAACSRFCFTRSITKFQPLNRRYLFVQRASRKMILRALLTAIPTMSVCPQLKRPTARGLKVVVDQAGPGYPIRELLPLRNVRSCANSLLWKTTYE
jgi:hypothetical protein